MQPSKHAIVLHEYEESDSLEDKLADRLHTAGQRAKKRLRENSVLERTRHGIQATHVVGIISVPGATLEILPKIDGEDHAVRKALVHMLAVAHNLRVADTELASVDTQRTDLLELLIALFANRLIVAVRRGLPRRYVGHEEDLPRLRGSLNVVRQWTRFAARPDMLACRFDELSEDTPLNRVFKAAVRALAGVARSAGTVRLLAQLAARLEFVGVSDDPLKERVRLDRTNTAYHDLYGMARMFLSGDRQSTTEGKSLGFSLLFSMPKLFESFVGRCLRRAVLPWRTTLQSTRHSALWDKEEHIFQLQPDIVVKTPTGTIVLDAKWKELKAEERKCGVSQADVYQILNYGQAYNAKRIVLLYPWRQGLEEGINRRWIVVGAEQRLDIATIDVGSPSTVNRMLRQLVYMDDEADAGDQPLRHSGAGVAWRCRKTWFEGAG